MARVALHRDGRSGAGGEFVGAENRCDRRARQQKEHGGNLDQTAAAHDRVDKTGEVRGTRKKQDQGHDSISCPNIFTSTHTPLKEKSASERVSAGRIQINVTIR
jgi:hypothetical protein